jgi:DNA-directed RNA polymerase, sigma subunit (sigma70/sigma32)
MGQEEVEKISNFLNVKPLQVQHMENKLALGDLSLNKTIDNEDGPDLLSILKANSLTPDEVVEKNNDNKLKNEWLAKSIELLNSREREIILSRNLNDKKITLDLIGKKLNISKERVRQIESAALKKLKKNIIQISKQPKDFFIN